MSKPFFSSSVSADSSPPRNLSQRDGVTSLRSKAAIAFAMLSKETACFSPGNASAKAFTYSGIEFSTFSTAAPSAIAISPGLSTGPWACASTSSMRPSQNCFTCAAALSVVGELRPPRCPL